MHCGMPAAAAIEPGEQGVGFMEPVEHAEPGGHGEHWLCSERFVVPLKLPASHGSGADAPGGQTDPGGHSSQRVALFEYW